MSKLILIGFMGAGKTTTAELLSQQLNVPMLDTDVMIAEETGQTPGEIFSAKGETAFRMLEKNIVQKALQQEGILATGGGVVETTVNRERLYDNPAPVYYLSGGFGQTMERIVDDMDRPILRNSSLSEIGVLWRSRLPKYEAAANVTIHTDGKTPQEIVSEIIEHYEAHYE
ncbi:shikimate kinase [Weissella ceti]|uniref:Shikimate kinase n=1 Tax=Weissella ceti TaxID=759620 RepID=A0ABT3E7B6_9LACO|nr:shikimate kinase [Weissella ceti]MCW0953842.1 shikimate kinase [Weissella ceti]QVK11661.1 shikimate kinase [Weissella ceti]